MMSGEFHDLVRRITRLERTNRNLKIVGATAIAALGLGLALGMSQGDRSRTLEGNGFKLYDEDGRVRASLSMIQTGPRLALMDEKGKTRIALTASSLGPNVLLFDENEESRLGATVTRVGAFFQTWSTDGKPAWRSP